MILQHENLETIVDFIKNTLPNLGLVQMEKTISQTKRILWMCLEGCSALPCREWSTPHSHLTQYLILEISCGVSQRST